MGLGPGTVDSGLMESGRTALLCLAHPPPTRPGRVSRCGNPRRVRCAPGSITTETATVF